MLSTEQERAMSPKDIAEMICTNLMLTIPAALLLMRLF
jgi:hypothetical protein